MARWIPAALIVVGCAQDITVLDAGPSGSPNAAADTGSSAGNVDAGSMDAGGTDDAGGMDDRNSGCTPETIRSPAGPSMFENIGGLAFDARGTLYAVSRRRDQRDGWITVVEPDHHIDRVLGDGVIGEARDISIGPDGNLYVLEWWERRGAGADDPVAIRILTTAGAPVDRWERTMGPPDEAWSLHVDGANRVNIGSIVVYRFEKDGTPIDQIGRWGTTNGHIARGRDLTADPRGNLWVADHARNMIIQFDSNSRAFITEIGGRGIGPGLFDGGEMPGVGWGPSTIVFDAAGALYASDPFVGRIMKLDTGGRMLAEHVIGGPRDLDALAISPITGKIYVGRRDSIEVLCPM